MGRTEISKTFLILIASSVVVISSYLLGEIRGIKQSGYSVADHDFPDVSKINLIAHGPNFYDEVTRSYTVIVVALGLYLVIKLLWTPFSANRTIKGVHLVISSIFFCVAGYVLGTMVFLKVQVLEADSSTLLPYYEWLRYSLQFDWITGLLLLILFLAEILSFVFLNHRSEI